MAFKISSPRARSSIWYAFTGLLILQLIKYPRLTSTAGYLGHARMDRLQGEPLRAHDGQDALLNLPGRLERPPARPRARDRAHGPS